MGVFVGVNLIHLHLKHMGLYSQKKSHQTTQLLLDLKLKNIISIRGLHAFDSGPSSKNYGKQNQLFKRKNHVHISFLTIIQFQKSLNQDPGFYLKKWIFFQTTFQMVFKETFL